MYIAYGEMLNLIYSQSKHVLDLLGADVKLALASRVTVLDKIARISAFAEKVVDLTAKSVEIDSAIAEVGRILEIHVDMTIG